MPLMRNPFRRAPGDVVTDPNGHPVPPPMTTPPANGQKPSSIDIKVAEYKLSEINDSGVFLPPSPPAKETPRFWTTRSTTSTSSSSHRSAMTEEDNPFTISRESFDSYRRSFDICARSPVIDHDAARPRHSADAARLRLPPPRLRDAHFNPPETQPEDKFEDVGLGGGEEATVKPKKQSFLARFGTKDVAQDMNGLGEAPRPASSHFPGRELFGRKRAPSASAPPAAELGSMPRPSGGENGQA